MIKRLNAIITDEAVRKINDVRGFFYRKLQQDVDEHSPFEDTISLFADVVS
ncbi:hypothetical protein [uncultured Shewanella sp.]|uniref:hypothetical protein n=1 Tax=uncultured Shewanella sp. TaxID=173975 RepID=UPI002626F03A|nr:hypothetical protein [uncultured Shewanella sp.]